ncbi:MAG: hypothetical protein ACI4KR_03065 [Ruminiclostridium sp.]
MKILFRYIVPFTIDDSRYDEVVEKLSTTGGMDIVSDGRTYSWKSRNPNTGIPFSIINEGKTEILNCVTHSISFDRNTAIGSVHELYSNEKFDTYNNEKEYIPYSKRLIFQLERSNYKFTLSDAKLLLFRTGIGFLCYDVEFDNEITAKTAEEFQSKFRILLLKSKLAEYRERQKQIPGTKDKEIYENLDGKPGEAFCIGDLVTNLVTAIGTDFSIWPIGSNIKGNSKAILYTYICTRSKPQSAIDLPYTAAEADEFKRYLSIIRGIKASYNDSSGSSIKPFEHISWITYYEGSGVIATPKECDENNVDFCENKLPELFKTDYFMIYILALYQSYSALHLSARIADELPGNTEAFKDENEMNNLSEKLEIIEHKINVFLLKSSFATVSHINQHNDYYDLCKKVLRIDADVKSLSDGVSPLAKMQRIRIDAQNSEKDKERSMREKLLRVLIAIFGLASILTDAVSFIYGFYEGDAVKSDISFKILFWVGLPLVIALVWYICGGWILRLFKRNTIPAKTKNKKK